MRYYKVFGHRRSEARVPMSTTPVSTKIDLTIPTADADLAAV